MSIAKVVNAPSTPITAVVKTNTSYAKQNLYGTRKL